LKSENWYFYCGEHISNIFICLEFFMSYHTWLFMYLCI
jgi:hypothetical protein